MGSIPLLATLDVHDHPRLEGIVQESAEFFASSRERVTYFIPSAIVLRYPGVRHVLRQVRTVGHSIGCHGLTHDASEDLGSLSFRAENLVLRKATEILEDALGEPIRSFRAPGFRISRRTLEILSELGYRADFSVTPQRLCVLSSSPAELGWLWAPRAPYVPRARYPFLRGNLELVEIPTSSLVLPLTHGTIANLPELLTRTLVAGLSLEATHCPRVLVPMFHPEAIVGEVEPWQPKFRWRDLIPSRVGGIRARFYFFLERDAGTIHRRTMATIRQLRQVEGLVSMSADDYLRRRVAVEGAVSSEFA
jgi:hypothetical protein